MSDDSADLILMLVVFDEHSDSRNVVSEVGIRKDCLAKSIDDLHVQSL